jgi:hypothetical protein
MQLETVEVAEHHLEELVRLREEVVARESQRERAAAELATAAETLNSPPSQVTSLLVDRVAREPELGN